MYYLHHYFNPDFSHMNLSPQEKPDGSVSYHYLGYVQNVVAGQVLAELVALESVPEGKRDPRFIYKEKYLPCGPNCSLHEKNPDKIVSNINGYCFYHKGLISVKNLLNIRGNIGFATGNILFVGDTSVHGNIQTGFALSAQNILVKGRVESSKVKAIGDIVVLGGVKGTSVEGGRADPDDPQEDIGLDNREKISKPLVPDGILSAGGNIRLPFCEHIQIRAKGNVIIDGSCLHSTLYVGGNLIVKGRLQGGAVYANKIIYVEKQLGSDFTSITKIFMGYDPFDYLNLQKLESQIFSLKEKVAYFEKQCQRSTVMEQEFLPRLWLVKYKLKIALARRNALWRKFSLDEESTAGCRIIVPGRLMPGCEINIAQAYHKTLGTQENVCFYLEDKEIAWKFPAVSHNSDFKLA